MQTTKNKANNTQTQRQHRGNQHMQQTKATHVQSRGKTEAHVRQTHANTVNRRASKGHSTTRPPHYQTLPRDHKTGPRAIGPPDFWTARGTPAPLDHWTAKPVVWRTLGPPDHLTTGPPNCWTTRPPDEAPGEPSIRTRGRVHTTGSALARYRRRMVNPHVTR